MMEALFNLPEHVRRRLAGALESGSLPSPCTSAAAKSVLGSEDVTAVITAVEELGRSGVTGPAAGVWIRTVEAAMAQAPSPDLVWSGPEVSGLHARDTRRVCQLVFARMDRTALTPYCGKYQGQSRATGSLISLDTDR